MRLIRILPLGAAAMALVPFMAAAQSRVAAVPAATTSILDEAPTTIPGPTAAPAGAVPASAAAPVTTASAGPATPVVTPDPSSDGVVATVNDTAISDYALDQRIAMHVAVSGYKPSAEDMTRIRKEMLERLEEEQIELADARKHKITVSPVEVTRLIDHFAKDHNTTVEQLSAVLAKAGTSIEELRRELTAATAWQKTLEAEFSDAVVVTPAMIADERRRAAEGANKVHYHVFEIFLQVDSPDKDAEVKKQMEEIETKVRNNEATFPTMAQQFSRNPSAAAGGDMGWVYDGQLDPQLNSVVAKMKPNELSHPVRGKGGWYLLGLEGRQEPVGTDVTAPVAAPVGPPGTLPLARLTLPLMPNTPQEVIANSLKVATTQIVPAIASCDVMAKLAKEKALEGSIFQNMGQTRLADLSQEMQKALAATKAGEVAQPFVSPAGIEIIARCDERAPPPRQVFQIPTEDAIHEELFQEQIAALAKGYMRNLKRETNIQERDQSNPIMDAALIP